MTIFPSFITKNGIARTNRFVVNIVPPLNPSNQSGNIFFQLTQMHLEIFP